MGEYYLKDKYPTRKLSKIKPHPNNPRTHTDEQIKKIARSIKELGWGRPIILSSDGYILAGHGAYQASRDVLGYTDAPIKEMKHKHNSPEALAYMVADNKLTDESDWNYADLEIVFDEIKLDGYDVELTGFDVEEQLEVETKIKGKQEVIEDDFDPDSVKESIVQPGQIWQLGNHRLMCGDSTKKEDVEQLMNGDHAELLFTSPPYNVGSLNIKGNTRTQPKYNKFDDKQPEKEYTQFIINFINSFIDFTDEIFINIGLVEDNKRSIIQIMDNYRNQFKDIIYWNKSTVAPHITPGIINNKVEFILCFGDGKRKFKHPQFSQGTYWNVIEGPNASGNEYSKIHKATFPIYLPSNIIENFSNPHSNVIDAFGGTGTSIIACEQLQRKCYMMELDPHYCDVIIQRWETFTKQKAELIT